MNELRDKDFYTRAVHAGERGPRPDFTPVVTPIYPSIGYLYDDMDDLDAIFGGTREGYVYTRYGSPTVTAFENAMANIEEGEADLAFGVDPAYRISVGEDVQSTGIGAALIESAIDWARAQPGLDRLCVQIRADNLPVSRLCCGYGFGERRLPAGKSGQGWIQLDCSL